MAKINIHFLVDGAKLGLRGVDDKVYTSEVLTAVGAKENGNSDYPIYGAIGRNVPKLNIVGKDSNGNRLKTTLRCSPDKISSALTGLIEKKIDFPAPSGSTGTGTGTGTGSGSSNTVNGTIDGVSLPFDITAR